MPTATINVKVIPVHAPLFTSNKRYIFDWGGRGSGKSVSASQAFLQRSLNRKGTAIAARKVANTLRLSIFPRLQNELSAWGILPYCKVNKTEMQITLPNGSVIYCIGADDPEKIKSVENPWLAWLEEMDSFEPEDFDAIDFSLRQGGDTIIGTFNPPPLVTGVGHWISDRFIDKDGNAKDPDLEIIHSNYLDNPYLPQKYVDRLLSLKDSNPELYRMWALGEFVGLSGAIFNNWDIVDNIPATAEFLGYGLDFGFATDPAALIAVYEQDQEYYYRQIIYETGLTNPSLAMRMRELGVERTESIIADSAEPKSIQELKDAGFFIEGAVKGADSIRAGIDHMKSRKQHIEKSSTDLIKEFGTYSWKIEKSSGRTLPVPVDMFNHGIDAARYRLEERYKSKTDAFSNFSKDHLIEYQKPVEKTSLYVGQVYGIDFNVAVVFAVEGNTIKAIQEFEFTGNSPLVAMIREVFPKNSIYWFLHKEVAEVIATYRSEILSKAMLLRVGFIRPDNMESISMVNKLFEKKVLLIGKDLWKTRDAIKRKTIQKPGDDNKETDLIMEHLSYCLYRILDMVPTIRKQL